MAHRILTQVVVTGARVFGRAFAEAYKQAAASSKHQGSSRNSPGGGRTAASAGLTLDEACKILNVPPPQGGKTNMEHVMERFKRMYDANDPKKGGSFYLQSKILRARERIELEVGNAAEEAAQQSQAKEAKPPS